MGGNLDRTVRLQDGRRSYGSSNWTLGARPYEFLQQLTLAGSELLGQLRMDFGVQVTAACLAEVRHTLAAQSEDPSILRPGGYLQCQASAIRRGNPRLTTQEQRRERRDHAGAKVVTRSLEARIGQDRDDQVQIPGAAAGATGSTLTRDPDAAAFGDPWRNLDFQSACLTVWLLELQHTGRTGVRLLQRDFEWVLQVGAGPRPRRSPTTRPAATATAEKGPEEIRKWLVVAEQVLQVFG